MQLYSLYDCVTNVVFDSPITIIHFIRTDSKMFNRLVKFVL